MNINEMYLELLKNALTDYHRIEKNEYMPLPKKVPNFKWYPLFFIDKLISKKNFTICKKNAYNKEARLNGIDWPINADTMIGLKRLNNIEDCVKDVLKNNIEGDLIETGVWRGGATIYMRALLKAFDNSEKIVWVADSFEGLPKPDEINYKEDKGDIHHTFQGLVISMDEVKNNFKKYGLLDEQVRFLKGWFKDTLPTAPIDKLSLLRLDGDMYESTMDGLVNLYPKLSVGGYIIIDDWGAVPQCKIAVEDYRKKHHISEEIKTIDWTGVYWKKEKPV